MLYSLVTVCCPRDRAKMLLQARSVARFVPRELVDQVLVVCNGKILDVGWDWLGDLVTAYGCHDVTLISQYASDVDGWWSQQAFKLHAATRVWNGRYVILDAKNHFVGPLTLNKLENAAGIPRTGCHDYRGHNMGEFAAASMRFFGLNPADHLGLFLQTVTPFVAYTRLALRTIDQVKGHWEAMGRAPENLSRIFAESRITEFMSYGACIAAEGLRLEDLYDPHQPGCRTLWASEISHLPAILKAADFMFAVHTEAWPKLEYRQCELIAGFWLERGLVGSFGEGMATLHACGARVSP